MIQTKNIMLYAPVDTSAERLSFSRPATPDIGYFDTVYPALIYQVQNKNRGIKQSNLFPVSAGNDLRMSTMRPNPYLSAGIKERGDYRGLPQFNSQPN